MYFNNAGTITDTGLTITVFLLLAGMQGMMGKTTWTSKGKKVKNGGILLNVVI